jgi:HEPN domain-containing protein
MADPLIVSEWLEKADEDFLFADANLREGSGFYAQLCFHFQQSAEKYLKAYIIGKNLQFDRVHDLVHLLKICSAHTPEFSELKEECIFLNTAI